MNSFLLVFSLTLQSPHLLLFVLYPISIFLTILSYQYSFIHLKILTISLQHLFDDEQVLHKQPYLLILYHIDKLCIVQLLEKIIVQVLLENYQYLHKKFTDIIIFTYLDFQCHSSRFLNLHYLYCI